MGFNIDVSVPVLTVFAQGLICFLSPCVLPLVPIYIGYLSGGAVETLPDGTKQYDRKRVMLHTLFFVLGVSFAFFLLGIGMNALGLFFRQNQRLFSVIGGVIIIAFGLYRLGLFGQVAALDREHRLPFDLGKKLSAAQGDEKRTAGKELRACLFALILGFFFSFAWTPCIGPTLTTVLLMAGSSANSAYGFLLIGVYTLGFCIPFLLTGLFTTSLLNFFKTHRNVMKYTVRIGALLMIATGILMITGYMNRISAVLAIVGA